MSKIKDVLLQAEDFDQDQYKKDTDKMHELDQKWRDVYTRTRIFLDYDQEFIDRETEKGGRHDW